MIKNFMPSLFLFFTMNFLPTALLAVSQPVLTKTFLLKTFQRLSDSPEGLPPKAFPFHTDAEKNFLGRMISFNFSDILAESTPKNTDLFSYNILNQRTSQLKFHDELFSRRMLCQKAYTKDGKNFLIKDRSQDGKELPEEYDDSDVLSFSYCLGEDLNSDPDRILYFFHGASGNPANFIDRRAMAEIREVWRKSGKLPRWVSISLGRLGTLMEGDKEHKFMNIIVPFIEKSLGFTKTHPVKGRLGLGISMGGANVTHLLLKQPNFFQSAVLICPAISFVDSMTSENTYDLYMKASHAWHSVVNIALRLAPKEFSNHETYLTLDPLIIGQKLLNKKTPPFYIQASSYDEFGFNGGARLFTMLARTQGAPVTFQEFEGRHCVVNPEKVVSFFISPNSSSH